MAKWNNSANSIPANGGSYEAKIADKMVKIKE